MLHAPGRDPPSDRVRVWEGGGGGDLEGDLVVVVVVMVGGGGGVKEIA